ncbi:MAG: methyltransferase domain-containing protein [Trueperaceae bacterium]|nr:methyltransferase domain-containing protein [Trueperaceae bacterium]
MNDGADLAPFAVPPTPDPAGFLRTDPVPRDRRAAARVNRLPLVAHLYEPLWRGRSAALLTRGHYRTRQERATLSRWLLPACDPAGPGGGRILDVGCGAGFYLAALHAAARDDARTDAPAPVLHGIDVSEAFLRRAAARLAREGVPATLALADAERLPYRDASFDGVAFGGTPNEVRDRPTALAELARVLRPGGRAFLMASVRGAGPTRALAPLLRVGGVDLPTADTLADEVEAAGLTPVRLEHRPPLLVATLRRPDAAPDGAPPGGATG